MIALDAKMVIHNSKGERVVNAEEFFVGPRIDITRLTQLQPEDLLVAIRIPKESAGARFYFEKVTDRATWDFALVNVAAAVKTDASGTGGGELAHRGRRRGGNAAALRRGRADHQGPESRSEPRGARRQVGDPRRSSTQLQCLQDPADGEPGDARRAGRASLRLCICV